MSLDDKKILICDDSIMTRKQLKDIIKTLGGTPVFIEAKNGIEAVDAYKEHKPDLCFLDIVMPVMDGSNALAAIKDFDENARVVIVSSIGTQGTISKVLSNGALEFVQKPFMIDNIKEIVVKYLGE